MQHIGIDIIEIPRIQKALDEWGEKFLRRVSTTREIDLYPHPTTSLAARFAAKEAVIKALNAKNQGIGFRDIEILAEPDGKPLITLHGSAQQLAQKLGINRLSVSLSHSRENAVAVALGEMVDAGTSG